MAHFQNDWVDASVPLGMLTTPLTSTSGFGFGGNSTLASPFDPHPAIASIAKHTTPTHAPTSQPLLGLPAILIYASPSTGSYLTIPPRQLSSRFASMCTTDMPWRFTLEHTPV